MCLRSVAWKGPNNQHEEETGAQHRTRRSRSICSERTRTRTITMTRTMTGTGTRTRSACDSGGEDDKRDGAFDGAVCDRRSSLAMTTMGRLPLGYHRPPGMSSYAPYPRNAPRRMRRRWRWRRGGGAGGDRTGRRVGEARSMPFAMGRRMSCVVRSVPWYCAASATTNDRSRREGRRRMRLTMERYQRRCSHIPVDLSDDEDDEDDEES